MRELAVCDLEVWEGGEPVREGWPLWHRASRVVRASLQRILILVCLTTFAAGGLLAMVKGDAHARRKHALAASLPAYAVDRLYAHQDGDETQYGLALANAQQAVTAFNGTAYSESEKSLAQTLELHLDYAKYCRWRTQNDSRSAIQETWRWCTDAHQNFEKLSQERVREIAAGK